MRQENIRSRYIIFVETLERKGEHLREGVGDTTTTIIIIIIIIIII
jgi:hypothetical protein